MMVPDFPLFHRYCNSQKSFIKAKYGNFYQKAASSKDSAR